MGHINKQKNYMGISTDTQKDFNIIQLPFMIIMFQQISNRTLLQIDKENL